jgi:hypothetical protein
MRLVSLAAAAVLFAPSAGLAQITAGQIDTFESGLQGWDQAGGGPGTSAPQLITGGPTGQYMQLTAGPSGAPRLTVFNRVQWLGDYIAAGVVAVEMDLFASATNPSPLSIRIAYKSSIGMNAPGYSSTTAFTLPNDGQWHHAVFPLTAGTMSVVGSPEPFATFMTHPAEMRILHSAGPSINGDFVTAVVGVDNIQAVPIPEPTGVLAAAAAAAGLAGVIARRRSKLRCR